MLSKIFKEMQEIVAVISDQNPHIRPKMSTSKPEFTNKSLVKCYERPCALRLLRELSRLIKIPPRSPGYSFLKCSAESWGKIKGCEAQIQHLGIPQNMHIEFLRCLAK